MPIVTMRELLESGVHFGHQTRRWNPKMKRFVFTERNGIYIVDLQQSLTFIDSAYDFVSQTVAHGGTVLFVGTKKQAQEPVAEQAARVGMPYVNQRWLGGMLTNFSTVHKRLQRLRELERIDFDDVAASGLTKKELLILRRELIRLRETLGGMRHMDRLPSAVWIVDTNKEHLAVAEARKLGIPVVAILDTNCDPDQVDYPIPGNDDAIRAVQLLTRVIADAVADGLLKRHSGAPAAAEGAGTVEAEPLAEWERELLAGAEADVRPEWERELLAGAEAEPARAKLAPSAPAEFNDTGDPPIPFGIIEDTVLLRQRLIDRETSSGVLVRALLRWAKDPVADRSLLETVSEQVFRSASRGVGDQRVFTTSGSVVTLLKFSDKSAGARNMRALSRSFGMIDDAFGDPDEWTVAFRVLAEDEDGEVGFLRVVRERETIFYLQYVATGTVVKDVDAMVAASLLSHSGRFGTR